jgi:glycosyltransferase involved in cell wall biosynthesis
MLPGVERIRHAQKLGDRLGDSDTCQLSLVVLFEGWPEDLERLHSSALKHLGEGWELIVVDKPVDDAASEAIAGLERVVHLPLRDPVGFGAGRNLGLRQATGRIVCIVDTSVEITGDVLTPLSSGLDDPSVGLVGRWGVSTDHGFHFEESDGPEVDGVEAYFMALRRADLPRIGLFDPKFKWYRNADLDFSFRVRDCGMRTIVDQALPIERHEHRLWENTPEAQREELSRKNFFRFRDHWAERPDLFVRRES